MRQHSDAKILACVAIVFASIASLADAGGKPVAVQRIIVEEQSPQQECYRPEAQQFSQRRTQRIIVEEQRSVYPQRIITQRVTTQRFVAPPRLTITFGVHHR